MSIPDPTIDPVTGLPLLNPSDVVQQIPLGVQAFPWQDMGATALPTRGPLYGDDILPVSAFVAGQHPQTGSAQTVQTDGAHALLVKDVNSSSGGGTIALGPSVVNSVFPLTSGTRQELTNFTTSRIIYGLYVPVVATALDAPGSFASVRVDAWDGGFGVGTAIGLGYIAAGPVGTATPGYIPFPTGVSLPASGFTHGTYSVTIQALGGDVYTGCRLILGP